MIIFLVGQDDYRRIEKKKAIVSEFRKKHSNLGAGSFSLSQEGSIEQFVEFVRGQSIFESAKLAVLEEVFEGDEDALAPVLRDLAPRRGVTILIAEREKPPKKLNFLLEKPVLVEKFGPLGGLDWVRFVEGEAVRRGVRLSPESLSFLASAHQGDAWRCVTELEKLRWIGKSLEKRELEDLGLGVTPNFWSLLSGLRSRRVGDKLLVLEQLFAKNEPAQKIFNIFAAFPGGDASQAARYDVAVKSGKLEYEEALLDLALS